MGYVDSNLSKGEQVVYRAKLHWIIYVLPAFLCIVIIGFPLLLLVWIQQVTSEFVVTNQRVMIKVGWIGRRTLELKLSKLESIVVDQGIFGRIFNYGAIVVVGTGGSREPFRSISDPLAFRLAVNRATEALQPSQASV